MRLSLTGVWHYLGGEGTCESRTTRMALHNAQSSAPIGEVMGANDGYGIRADMDFFATVTRGCLSNRPVVKERAQRKKHVVSAP
jgi:hypothetical protein